MGVWLASRWPVWILTTLLPLQLLLVDLTSSTKVAFTDEGHVCWKPFVGKVKDFDVFEYSNHTKRETTCLYLSNTPASYNDSVRACRDLNTNLMMIKDEAKNKYLVDSIMRYKQSHRLRNGAWIGLKWRLWTDIGWKWRWIDHEPLDWAYGWVEETKSRYYKGERDVCALVKPGMHSWDMQFCNGDANSQLPYLCEWEVDIAALDRDRVTTSGWPLGTDPQTLPDLRNGDVRAGGDSLGPADEDRGGGQLGMYIGIAMGAVVGTLIAVAIVIVVLRKRRKKSAASATTERDSETRATLPASVTGTLIRNGKVITKDDIIVITADSEGQSEYETIPDNNFRDSGISQDQFQASTSESNGASCLRKPQLNGATTKSYASPRAENDYECAKSPEGLYEEAKAMPSLAYSSVPLFKTRPAPVSRMSSDYEDIDNIRPASRVQCEQRPLLEETDPPVPDTGEGGSHEDYTKPCKSRAPGDDEVTMVENDIYT